MKKGIILMAIGALALLAGCNSKGSDTIHLQPKWQGSPYHISFDTPPAKPNPSGLTIPAVKYEANPDMLENRACLVVRFDVPPAVAKDQTVMNQMIMGGVDIHGTSGILSSAYMDSVDEGLARLLDAYHIKGKVKVSVLLARPLLSGAGQSDIDENKLSDWLSTDLEFKSAHAKR